MKKISMFMAVLAIFALTGCASISPQGNLFTNVTLPASATSNTQGTKVGVASCTSLLGLVATGDASIKAAMTNGNITKVSHVDWKVVSEIPLGIKTVYTTTVYGN